MKTISVFVPCYNEEGSLRELYRRLDAVAADMSQYAFEFVVSDNKSTDTSRDILRELAAQDKRLKLIFNTRNFGPGRSGAYGFFQTSGDVSICIAADLQDPPELIPDFVAKWEEGYKVVLGRNPSSKEPTTLRLFRSLYYKLVSRFSAHDEYDHVSGFGLYDKEVVDLLRAEGNPSPNFRLSLSEFGYSTTFIDYVKPERTSGSSSYSFGTYVDTAVDSVVGQSKELLYFIIKVGVVASAAFFLAMLACLIAAIVGMSYRIFIVAMLFLVCLGCSLIALVVGCVGIYAAFTLDWQRQRPLVIEEERINFEHGVKA